MDPKLLADTLTTFLAPAMPFLIEGGEDLVRKAGKKLGEDGLELAKRLWEKLRPKTDADPVAKAATGEVAKAPERSEAQGMLRLQLERLLEADPDLASELARMMEAAGSKAGPSAIVYGSGAIAQGRGAVAAGKGGIAVGGNVQGDLSVLRRKRGKHGRAGDD